MSLADELIPERLAQLDVYDRAYQQALVEINQAHRKMEAMKRRYRHLQFIVIGLAGVLGVEAPVEHDFTNPNNPNRAANLKTSLKR